MYIHLGQQTPTPTAPRGATGAVASLSLTRVRDSRVHPFRCICRIVARPYKGNKISIGTGVLIGPSHVLTCAHVISPPGLPIIKEIIVHPAQNGPDKDWPGLSADGWAINPWWRGNNCHTAGEDLGIVRLARPTNGGFWPLAPFDPSQLIGAAANLAGYPDSKAEKARLMFRSHGPVLGAIRIDACTEPTARRKGTTTGQVLPAIAETTKLIAHGLDTAPSMSGGPMWTLTDGKRALFALHAGDIEEGKQKKAVLLSEAVRQRVAAWTTRELPPLP